MNKTLAVPGEQRKPPKLNLNKILKDQQSVKQIYLTLCKYYYYLLKNF